MISCLAVCLGQPRRRAAVAIPRTLRCKLVVKNKVINRSHEQQEMEQTHNGKLMSAQSPKKLNRFSSFEITRDHRRDRFQFIKTNKSGIVNIFGNINYLKPKSLFAKGKKKRILDLCKRIQRETPQSWR